MIKEPEYTSIKGDLRTEPLCKVAIATLGCKVNRYESAALEESLQKKNFRLVPFNSPADVYIINTCTVTALSDFQARQLIRRAHKTNHQAKILVTGCYAQIASSNIAAMEEVSMIIGNNRKAEIPEFLEKGISSFSSILIEDISRQKEFQEMPLAAFGNRTRAFLKIQDGCNSFCSYCIVPFARGISRSMPPAEVLSALDRLDHEGYKEVVLTGIHLGMYGYDLEQATNISDILHQICDRRWDTRIRLSSIEPREVTGDLLDIIKNNELICPHLHIPLQSGDDLILRLMKRNYDSSFFRNLIEKINYTLGDVAIGVDVMVGFPSESEEQFKNTLHLLEDLPVSYLHVFPYSPRPGTEAQKIRPQIPGNIKKERARILRKLSEQKWEKFALRFLGKPLNVLVESTKDKKTGLWKGFSQNYLPFLLDESFTSSVNKIAKVRAESYQSGKFYGKIITR